MLPSNINLKDLYDSTLDFLSIRTPLSPTASELPTGPPGDVPPPRASRESSILRQTNRSFDNHIRGHHSQCSSPCSCNLCEKPLPPISPNLIHSNSLSMRKNSRDYESTKGELIRTQNDVVKLEDRCRALERTLRETKEMLRVRDAEIERLRRERDSRPPPPDRRRMRNPRLEHVASEPYMASKSKQSQSSSRRSPDSGRSHRQSTNAGHYMPSAAHEESSASGTSSSSEEDEAGEEAEEADEEERAHLRGLDTFLTKVDRFSGAQIIQALQDLNSEILQFAASATELCTFDKYSRATPARTTQATKETAARLGPSLARFLSSRDHTQDPILVQLALQACVATCISRALGSFCFGFASKPNAVLSQIYVQMYSSEAQSISSRWRSLTHRHIQELYPRLEEFAVNDLIETIFRWSSDVFIISGCSNPPKASYSIEGLRSRFGTQVRRISSAVYKLAKITREDIMSTNFEIIAVENGMQFSGKEMTDAFEDYGSSGGAVLCTTDMGLSCGTRKGEGIVERRLLLRPKVVLESVTDVLDPR